MNWQLCFGSLALATSVLLGSSPCATAQYAAEVVSYAPGTTPATGFDDQTSPLGEPAHMTGAGNFVGAVTTFNPPYLTNQILSIGEGGWLTLRLSHYVLPQTNGPEIGVFTNTGLIDIDWPNGQVGSPAGTFGADSATVEVSENNVDWESLGEILFNVPTNAYTDVAATTPSDFQQPFAGTLSSFDGLSFSDVGNPDILDLLAGSGGGTWIDISSTNLAQVGYIRFSVTDDADAGTELNFELDAVSINSIAMGTVVPEPSTLLLAGLMGLSFGLTGRRRS